MISLGITRSLSNYVGGVATGVEHATEQMISAGLRTEEKGCHMKCLVMTPEKSHSQRNLSTESFHNILYPVGLEQQDLLTKRQGKPILT